MDKVVQLLNLVEEIPSVIVFTLHVITIHKVFQTFKTLDKLR